MRYDGGDTECNETKLQTAPLSDADVERADSTHVSLSRSHLPWTLAICSGFVNTK